MNKALDVKITDLKERCASGVLKYRQMGCWKPEYEPKDTDILAVFRITPQDGVDPEEAAVAAGESSTATWTGVWTDRLTDCEYYRAKLPRRRRAVAVRRRHRRASRDDLVVILAGYKDRMDTFFRSNPGMVSRIAHHIDFPDYSADELFEIADVMAATMHQRFDDAGRAAFREYIALRMQQPRFSSARSIRNGIDRAGRAARPAGARDHHRGGHPSQPGVLPTARRPEGCFGTALQRSKQCRTAARRCRSSSSRTSAGLGRWSRT